MEFNTGATLNNISSRPTTNNTNSSDTTTTSTASTNNNTTTPSNQVRPPSHKENNNNNHPNNASSTSRSHGDDIFVSQQEESKWTLSIDAGKQLLVYLVFKPNRLMKHDFKLPLHITGIPSDSLSKVVTAESLMPPLR